jgi:large subunit ribosomal protein L19
MSGVTISPVNMKERASLGIRPGDTVRVWQKIIELKQTKGADKKEKTVKSARRQAFEGLVLAVKHGTESGATFTVRRVASGVGVEKIFPLYSPTIDSVEVLRRARTRRAKLYFIREKAARDARHAMRKVRAFTPTSVAVQELEGVQETAVEATPQTEESAVE